jgi:hypothetical protein
MATTITISMAIITCSRFVTQSIASRRPLAMSALISGHVREDTFRVDISLAAARSP